MSAVIAQETASVW